MAAHIVTILTQIRSNPASQIQHLEFAVGHAAGFDSLDLEDWRVMRDLAVNQNVDRLAEFVDAVLPKYEQKWERLGRPVTCEDWMRKEYGRG